MWQPKNKKPQTRLVMKHDSKIRLHNDMTVIPQQVIPNIKGGKREVDFQHFGADKTTILNGGPFGCVCKYFLNSQA